MHGGLDASYADVTVSSRKPAWEKAVRARLGLRPYSTANDGAAVLLRVAALFALAALLVCCCCPRPLAWLAVFAASSFASLALHQYAWYTARIHDECWSDEGAAVVSIVALSACLVLQSLGCSPRTPPAHSGQWSSRMVRIHSACTYRSGEGQ